MITNGKQNWQIGQQVKIGFMAGLTVIGKTATPGDYAPDAYILAKGASYYSFVPHNDLTKIDQRHAEGMIAEGKRIEAKAEAKMKADADAWADAQRFQAAMIAAA